MSKTYTIKRSDWNGMLDINSIHSMLYDPDRPANNMCCLGIIACQLGIPKDKIAGHGDPENVADGDTQDTFLQAGFLKDAVDGFGHVTRYNSELSHKAIDINDSTLIPSEKEAKLTELFKKHNITLIFED